MSTQDMRDEMREVVADIVRLIHPEKIILFSQKHSLQGEMVSFKLCVVADCADKAQTERQLYLELDSPVPFDVVLYTPEEFAQLKALRGTFASKVRAKGKVLYEA